MDNSGCLFDVGGHKFKGRAVIKLVHFSALCLAVWRNCGVVRNLDFTRLVFLQARTTKIRGTGMYAMT